MDNPQPSSEPPETLWQKLLRQKVIQTLALYVPVGWMLIEIVTAVSEQFDLPAWVINGAMVLYIAGIPVTAFLAWAFQWTDKGVATDVKGWRGGVVLTVAGTLLFGVSAFLYLNLRQEALLENTGALTDPVAVIAVLPFVEQSSNDSALGTRFALEITDRLSKHPDLYVISSRATFAPILASMIPVRQQQELNADHVISGEISVDEQGHILKVSLLDSSQQLLWQDEMRFGADAASQAGLQRRISQRVARVLGTRHRSSEYCEPSDNLEALEAYHLAKLRLNQKGPEHLAEAESLLKKAIGLDPDYGHAYSALAVAYMLQSRWKPEYHSGTLAVDIARKALDRCPTLGVAYKIWVPAYEGLNNEHIDQELQWRDALAMAPNDLWLLDNYANSLASLGMIQASTEVGNRMERINPLDPRTLVGKAWGSLQNGDTERALELMAEAVALGDESCNGPNLRLRVGILTSLEMAVKEWENFPEHCNGGGVRGLMESLGPTAVYQARHDRAARRELLDYMRQQLSNMPNMAMLIAIENSDLDLAYDAIDYGLKEGRFIFFSSWWEDNEATALFRRDPRFAELVAQLGFVEYWQEFGWPGSMCTPLGNSFVCEN